MSKEKEFEKFLCDIEPSQTTKQYISSIQNSLREYLEKHEPYKHKVLDTFLTGSYAKHTSIRPTKYDGKIDVDIVVLTNYTENDDSKKVLNELYEVCKQTYPKVTKQSRSVGIEMSGIEIDVVPMIVDKRSGVYKIGNKKDGKWEKTNPRGHISWCSETNKNNYNKFVKIVKIFKWWRKNNCSDSTKYPKGIALEKIIADNIYDCNNDYESIVFNTMKNIKNTLEYYMENEIKPFITDPGIYSNNLSDGYEFNDFKAFYERIKIHIKLLEESDFSYESWRKILGREFPNQQISEYKLLENCKHSSFFNVPHKAKAIWEEANNVLWVKVRLSCYDNYNNKITYNPDENSLLNKGVNLDFEIEGAGAFAKDVKVFWQVVNTGDEAKKNHCLRGRI